MAYRDRETCLQTTGEWLVDLENGRQDERTGSCGQVDRGLRPDTPALTKVAIASPRGETLVNVIVDVLDKASLVVHNFTCDEKDGLQVATFNVSRPVEPWQGLFELVEDRFGVTKEQIRKGKDKHPRVVLARHICGYLLKERYGLSALKAAEVLGVNRTTLVLARKHFTKGFPEETRGGLLWSLQHALRQYKGPHKRFL